MVTNDDRTRDVTDAGTLVAQIYDFRQSGPVVFPTPDSAEMQCGFGQIDDQKQVPPHIHNIVERKIRNTSEFILVLEGAADIVFLNEDGKVIDRATLASQQGFLQYVGGHKITFHAGTRYLELKQGPYLGHDKDKYVLDDRIETKGQE